MSIAVSHLSVPLPGWTCLRKRWLKVPAAAAAGAGGADVGRARLLTGRSYPGDEIRTGLVRALACARRVRIGVADQVKKILSTHRAQGTRNDARHRCQCDRPWGWRCGTLYVVWSERVPRMRRREARSLFRTLESSWINVS
jgi:hypothetical protein